MSKKADIETTAEAYLELLAARGVEYFFGNAGTDFAPVIEAYARRGAHGQLLPRPITVPHEAPAVGMAHGYAMITGRPQAVMVHVIVGTANALGGVINAARGNVPMLFTAGRNPITEAGLPGSRERQIHWAQESFDQGAMVREFVKWDYELRNFIQLETVVDRALAITQAEPQGPVYLTLPREVLAERHESLEYADPSRAPRPSDVVAAPDAVEEAARILAVAKNPVVIAKALGRDPRAVDAMVKLAEVAALPVVDHFHTHVNFPQDHPLHAGFDATPYLDTADAIVVVESDAPWFPHVKSPRPETKLVQIGVDPLFSRYPIRGFGADVALAGTVRLTLAALADALRPRVEGRLVDERRPARRPGQDRHLHGRRRRLHLRRADRGALRRARLRRARALRRLQQPGVERGEARRARPGTGRLRGENRRDGALRPRAGARLRARLPGLRRPRRARGGPGRAARRARPRAEGGP